MSRLKRRYVYVLSVFLAVLFTYNSWTFISGQVLKTIHWGSNNMTNIIKLNPDYEKALAFLKALPDDGKVFNFPFTDFTYQVVPGVNRGAYIGPSPTAYLTGRRDFSGYQTILPFSDIFLKLVKEKNYSAIKRLFSILDVKYIFYIADKKAYQESFPQFPYSLFLESIPNSKSLTSFVGKLSDRKIFQQGDYFIYQVNNGNYLPHFYVPTSILPYDNKGQNEEENVSFFVDSIQGDPRVGYMERSTCEKLFTHLDCKQKIKKENIPSIIYKRINPIKYSVEVSGAKVPFVLIFSDQFHKDWKAYISKKEPKNIEIKQSYFNGSIQEYKHEDVFFNDRTFETKDIRSISEKQHFTMNGYANVWYIMPTDFSGNENHEIIVEMVGQRIFYYSLIISSISLLVFLLYGAKLLMKQKL